MAWISANLATILTSIVLAAILILVIVYLVSSKKKGKSTCSCGCGGCPMSESCHGKKQ